MVGNSSVVDPSAAKELNLSVLKRIDPDVEQVGRNAGVKPTIAAECQADNP